MIEGPYARLLAESVNLGPARSEPVHLTVSLQRNVEPVLLTSWARDRGLSVRWREGDDWATVEGSASAVAAAFGVSVRDYRIRAGVDAGRVFYASPSSRASRRRRAPRSPVSAGSSATPPPRPTGHPCRATSPAVG